MITFCRSDSLNKKLKESFIISFLLIAEVPKRRTLCTNTRLYCPKSHTLAMIGAQCGVLIFSSSDSVGVPDLFNIVDPCGYGDVCIGDMWTGLTSNCYKWVPKYALF